MALPKMAELKKDATEARLATLPIPYNVWTATARKDALARVRAMGLPHARDEYWKYTKPGAFVSTDVPAGAVGAAIGADLPADCLTITFTDGVFDADASDDLSGEGLEIGLLTDAANIHWASDVFGVLETAGQDPVHRPLAALNTAFAGHGVLIRASAKVSKPVHLVYNGDHTAQDLLLHHVVKVEDGAEMTLIETGFGGVRSNVVTEVEIADHGSFHHLRLQTGVQDRAALTHLFTRLGTESSFKSFTLTVDGKLTRNECVIELTGDDASAHVGGACLGDSKDVLHDDTVFITHDAVNCESRQVFKKVLRNGATGVFQGKILVKKDAQKTDGYQISQSLLLDDDSQFLAKPELEIYADDVACSHGSTSGAMDEDGLFYARARGVPKGIAEDLMTIAFVAEAVQEIDDDALQEVVLAEVEKALAGRRG